jgi:hypothetical protein
VGGEGGLQSVRAALAAAAGQQLLDRGEVEEAQLLGAVDRPLERAAVDDGGDVEQRSRQGCAGDAVLDGRVLGYQRLSTMDLDSRPRAPPAGRDRDVDGCPVILDEPPQSSCGLVRQHRLIADRQYGGHPLAGDGRVNGEDTSMQAPQPSRRHAMAHRPAAQSHRFQLRRRHDTMARLPFDSAI